MPPFPLLRFFPALFLVLLSLTLIACQTMVFEETGPPPEPVVPDEEFAEGIPIGSWEHRRRLANVVAPLKVVQQITLTPTGQAVVWTHYDANNDTREGIGYGRFLGQPRVNWVTNQLIRTVSREDNTVIIDTAAAKRPRLARAHPKGSSLVDLQTLGGTMPASVLFGVDEMGVFTFEIDGKDLILVNEESGTRIRYQFLGRQEISLDLDS